MTSWDSFLEALALELQESVGVDDDESEQVVFERVLRSRLLPLLEAGQAMAKCCEMNCGLCQKDWDAAKEAALKGKT